MSSANEIIMDRPQGSRKDLASLDEPSVELRLDMLMPPFFGAELCELDQGRDLSVQNGKIGSTGTGVKVSLIIGALSCTKAVSSFCQIGLPTHDLILPAPWDCNVSLGSRKLLKGLQGINQFLDVNCVR
jgi:hypothetical protein